MFINTSGGNENYFAKLTILQHRIDHPNADNLIGWIIDGNRVWTTKDYNVGEEVVYFPIESQINPVILNRLNLYQTSALNQDQSKKGYFGDHGRVKAVKLRGEPSEGIVLRWKDILSAIDCSEYNPVVEDKYFDTISYEKNTVIICNKYVPVVQQQAVNFKDNRREKNKIRNKFILIDNQFRFHQDTPQFKANLNRFKPDNIISITDKWHGTSGVSARVLIKKRLSWFEKILSRFVNITTTEYTDINSSRTVIKSIGKNKKHGGYYGDLWNIAHESIKHALLDGITLYYEIVGFNKNSYIQKDYDYGCKPGEFKVIVYRITYTSPDGNVIDFTWQQIKDYCTKFGLTHAVELYYGRLDELIAREIYSIYSEEQYTDRLIGEELLNYARRYLEQNCKYCFKKVPAEGIVIKIDGLDNRVYKLKSFAFLQKESKDLDTANHVLN